MVECICREVTGQLQNTLFEKNANATFAFVFPTLEVITQKAYFGSTQKQLEKRNQ